jgi:hypothetical protein
MASDGEVTLQTNLFLETMTGMGRQTLPFIGRVSEVGISSPRRRGFPIVSDGVEMLQINLFPGIMMGMER